MFFPLFIRNNASSKKVVSGEHYTSEWWMKKCSFDSVHKTAARLNALARKGIVEKVSAGECEIVRFIPTANYCENNIIEMMTKPIDKTQ